MRRIIKKEISQDKRTVMMQLDKEYRLMSIDTTKLRKFPYNYTLRNYDGKDINLESLKGKVILLGFIYTHCPDICPMITQNMKEVRNKLKRKDVVFLSITIDPQRDDPKTLSDYRKIYDINWTDWYFLTGDSATIDEITSKMGIEKAKYKVGETYFLSHTDRLFVIDKDGYVVGYFLGSKVEPDSVIRFLRNL